MVSVVLCVVVVVLVVVEVVEVVVVDTGGSVTDCSSWLTRDARPEFK